MTGDELRNLVASMRRFLETAWVGLHQENMAREQMARAADALAETLPEERDGRCLCGHCEHVSGRWCEFSPTWPDGEPEAGPVRWSHCPDCGAHLGADGIARRNADAARVERVRDLIADGCAAYPETIWPQPTPEEPGSEAERRAECWVATGARLAYQNMRAAIDGQPNSLPDGRGSRRWSGCVTRNGCGS